MHKNTREKGKRSTHVIKSLRELEFHLDSRAEAAVDNVRDRETCVDEEEPAFSTKRNGLFYRC